MNQQEEIVLDTQTSKDKIADIKHLLQIIKVGHELMTLGDHPIDPSTVARLLLKIAEEAQSIAWKNKNSEYIRNRYGKKNYSTSGNNNNYIDLELLAAISQLLNDPTSNGPIVTIICKNFADFIPDFKKLIDNCKLIIQQENPPEAIFDGIDELQLEEVKSKKIENLVKLPILLEFYYDRILFKEIRSHCKSNQVTVLRKTPPDEHTRDQKYTTARILTSIGEAAKNLSDKCKSNYGIVPLDVYIKVRNKIAHHHRMYILNKSPQIYECLHELIAILPSLEEFVGHVDGNYLLIEIQGDLAEKADKLWLAIQRFMDFDYAHTVPHFCTRYLTQQSTTVKDVIDTKWSQNPLIPNYDPVYMMPIRARRLIKLKGETKKMHGQLATANYSYEAGEIDEKADLNSKKTRVIEKLQTLKSKVEPLDIEEQKIFAQCTNDLAKIEEKIISTQAARQTLDIPQQKQRFAYLESEIEHTVLLPQVTHTYERLLRLKNLEKPVKKSPPLSFFPSKATLPLEEQDDSSRLVYLLRNLEEEMHFLSFLHQNHCKATSEGERLYAIEHSVSVIGQCFRDIDDLQSRLFGSLLNETVHHSITSTVEGRNKLIMHSLFHDNGTKILTLSNSKTMPIQPDIEAMNFILNTEPTKFSSYLSFEMCETLNKIGAAFSRLGNYSEAERHFRMAIASYKQTHSFEDREAVLSTVLRVTKTPVMSELSTLIAEIIDNNKTHILYIYSPEEMHMQFKLFANLADACALLNKHDIALRVLHYCYTIARDYQLHLQPNFSWIAIINYVVQLHDRNDPRANDVMSYITPLLVNERDYLSVIWINLGNICYNRKEYSAGLTHIEKVNILTIQDVTVQIEFYRARSLLVSGMTDALQKHSRIEIGLYLNAISKHREALQDIQTALRLLDENKPRLIKEKGHRMRLTEDSLPECLGLVANALANTLGTYSTLMVNTGDAKSAIESAEEARLLHERHGLDASTTYFNLAQAYLMNAAGIRQGAPHETRQIQAFAMKAANYAEKSMLTKNPSLCCKAYVTLAFIYEFTSDPIKSINYALLAYGSPQIVDISDEEKIDLNDLLIDSIAQLALSESIDLALELMTNKEYQIALKLLDILHTHPEFKNDQATELKVSALIEQLQKLLGLTQTNSNYKSLEISK